MGFFLSTDFFPVYLIAAVLPGINRKLSDLIEILLVI